MQGPSVGWPVWLRACCCTCGPHPETPVQEVGEEVGSSLLCSQPSPRPALAPWPIFPPAKCAVQSGSLLPGPQPRASVRPGPPSLSLPLVSASAGRGPGGTQPAWWRLTPAPWQGIASAPPISRAVEPWAGPPRLLPQGTRPVSRLPSLSPRPHASTSVQPPHLWGG